MSIGEEVMRAVKAGARRVGGWDAPRVDLLRAIRAQLDADVPGWRDRIASETGRPYGHLSIRLTDEADGEVFDLVLWHSSDPN